MLIDQDPEIAKAIQCELERQRQTLELIAAENFTSPAVLEAQGSVMTNKYAEGYPHKRYYGGCQYVDAAEDLARERAIQLFGGDHVNVQPHSGSQANMAVYYAALKPGDTVMGLDLAHGGHLTHGSPVNFSGIIYNSILYGVDRQSEVIDYDELRRKALKYQPKMIIAGASAYPRQLDFKAFRGICNEIDAILMVDMAHIAGLVAAGLHPTPIREADFVTTTTHKTLRGPRGGMVFCNSRYAANLDKVIFPGMQGGPLMHVIAAKAVALREALTDEFKEYQRQIIVNAKTLADTLMKKGFRLISGGTDTHLVLVNLRAKGLTGKEAEEALDRCGITVNKNTIPFDTQSPFVTSGIRIGTPAITTRGMKENEMEIIGDLISTVLDNGMGDDTVCRRVKEQVSDLCQRFPLYQELQNNY